MAITVIPEVRNALALVASGQPSEAGRALQRYADAQGDTALATALQTVPSAELGQILVATATSPSMVIANLITPDQFVKALLEVPKTWRPDQEDQALRDLEELFIGVVMQLDEKNDRPKKAKAYLDAIWEDGEAIRLLGYWLKPYAWGEGQTEVEVEDDQSDDDNVAPSTSEPTETMLHPAATRASYEYHVGDWDHLLVILRREYSGMLDQMIEMWKSGIDFTDLLPRVTATATQADEESALGARARDRLSSDSHSSKISNISMF